MEIIDQISLCSQNYQKWKDLALFSQDREKSRQYLEKAFFWLELRSAFITLFAAEQAKGKDPVFKNKILMAKASLLRKLTEYAEKTLNELK
jgi:hypothetical protein